MRPPAASSTSSHQPLRGRRVEVRGRLVEHEHRRVGEQRAREHEPLALAAGELAALLADERVEAVGQRARPSRASRARRSASLELGVGRVRARERAGSSRMLVEKRCASWPATAIARADVVLAVLAQVAAGERDAARLGVEEAQQQVRDRRLAGAARPDERDARARARAAG